MIDIHDVAFDVSWARYEAARSSVFATERGAASVHQEAYYRATIRALSKTEIRGIHFPDLVQPV